ncbi:MAG: organomercurial lyase [Gemmatimonadales bacterium]
MTATLKDLDWRVRGSIYRHFIDTTKPPSLNDLTEAEHATNDEVADSLRRLDARHQIALAPGSLNVWMANPFSAFPTEYPAETPNGRYWTNCAWDAMGVPAIIDKDSWTRTRCQETGTPIEFGVKDGKLFAGSEVIHIAVCASAFYDNIGFT